jgi:hypothetical protein
LLLSVRFTFNFETKMTEVRCTPHMQSITVLKSDTMDLVKTDSLSDREIFPRRYGKKFAYFFLKVYLYQFSLFRDKKSQKEVTK